MARRELVFSISAYVLFAVLAGAKLFITDPLTDHIVYLFGLYAFIVVFLDFFEARSLWIREKPEWSSVLLASYLITLGLAVCTAILASLPRLPPRMPWTIGGFGVPIMTVSFFLFPVGIMLIILGLLSLQYSKTKPQDYLFVSFVSGVGFLFSPVIAFFGSVFTGAISVCYCPVNRRSFCKHILLRPLYNYRKTKLSRKLGV